MNLTSYVDYTLSVSPQASLAEVANAASSLMSALHYGFTKMPNIFALALPSINEKSASRRLRIFRVFAPSAGDHASLFELMKQSPNFDKLFLAKFPRAVPEDFKGPYVAYYRDRIKSRKASPKSLSSPRFRFEKMTQLLENNALWIDMFSNSNQKNFRMYIATELHQEDLEQSGQVNAYGLSIAGKPVMLPNLPV